MLAKTDGFSSSLLEEFSLGDLVVRLIRDQSNNTCRGRCMNFKVLWIAGLMLAATAGQVQAAFVYNFSFTTSTELGSTGQDGAVTGYFSLDDSTNGIINNLSDALGINELVVTSDTTGSGFVPIGQNLLTYSNPSFGITGWQLLSYNSFIADGNTATGQLIFAAAVGGAVGGLRPALTIGIAPGDDRVGIITWNPDGGENLGNRKTAAGALSAGDTLSITAAPSAVPEPTSIAMWGISAVGMAFARRKRRQMMLAA